MANELTNTREHLKHETVLLLEAIVRGDMKHAENNALTIINLIHHIKRIEQRDAVT
jgi:hypothetical protein